MDNFACMNVVVTEKLKESWLQIRIDEDTKADAKVAARLRGLSLSSLVHSLLVRVIREEKELSPRAFVKEPKRKTVPTTKIKVGATKETKESKVG
jgi:antitoxin component of RelBE/YafQ-DinJ toxin-antitoxin module